MKNIKIYLKITLSLIIKTSIIMSMISCSKITPKKYIENQPKLDIRQYLNGKIKAWGMLENRKGEITRRFTVDMNGKWDKNKGTLEEFFTFDDKEKSKRTWQIEFIDDNNFTASAEDTIGIAKGSQYGNAMQMNYVLDLKIDENTKYKVTLDDWMYLIDEKTLVNKSKIKKFGITFAKLTIFFQKIDD